MYILTNSEHLTLRTEIRMKVVSGEPVPFLVASFLFAPVGLTAYGGSGVFSSEVAETVFVSPQPTNPAGHAPMPPAVGGLVDVFHRCVPYLIPAEVQLTDV
jgi:hypothetical protein